MNVNERGMIWKAWRRREIVEERNRERGKEKKVDGKLLISPCRTTLDLQKEVINKT